MSYYPRLSILHLLHRASQVADDLFSESGGENLDVTPRQLLVLAAAAKKEGLSQTDIVRLTGVDRSTLADIVQRLIRRGHLTRKRNKNDARAYMLAVTPEGQGVLDAAEEIAKQVDDRMEAHLGPAGADLVRQLKALVVMQTSPVFRGRRTAPQIAPRAGGAIGRQADEAKSLSK